MSELNKYYVYVYCNPLKPGIYSYQENGIGIDFPCAPFYIGKGAELRLEDHLKEARRFQEIIEEESIQEEINKRINWHKINTINKIEREGKEVIVYKICENMEEETSYLLERFLIKLIGRADLKTGILTNMTDGGEGFRGIIKTEESIKKGVEERKKTYTADPTIIIRQISCLKDTISKRDPIIHKEIYENRKMPFEGRPEEKENFYKSRNVNKIINKKGFGKDHPNFIKLNYKLLIILYFSLFSFNEMRSIYSNIAKTKKVVSLPYFLKILNFPLNTLASNRKEMKNIYLKFVEENKHKIDWYIENYERLEEEYFDKLWYEKYKSIK